jgi:drug/metabolite transporter (DMT)-like permease
MTSTVATASRTADAATSRRSGLTFALISAATFGLSGSLARSLIEIGWTPAAVVAVRIGGAFVLLLVPCLSLLRRSGLPTIKQGWRMVAYGIVAVALAQLCFFSAVQYLSVGVALLLEYSAPVMLIGWQWARTRRRPATSVFVGAALAVVGLVNVLDLTSGVTVHPIGVAWGLAAALCLCAYFILSEQNESQRPLPPLLLTTVGTGVGAVLIVAAGGLGLVPLAANLRETTMSGQGVAWWVPAGLLILVSAVVAYLTGIVAVRRLGTPVASFVALSEVIFAVVFAMVLLDQQPRFVQLVGGVLVLAGIAVVQRGGAFR